MPTSAKTDALQESRVDKAESREREGPDARVCVARSCARARRALEHDGSYYPVSGTAVPVLDRIELETDIPTRDSQCGATLPDRTCPGGPQLSG